MKKIYLILLSVFFGFFLLPSPSFAQTSCSLTTNPASVTTDNDRIDLIIDGNGNLIEGKQYYVKLDNEPAHTLLPIAPAALIDEFYKFTLKGGKLTLNQVAKNGTQLPYPTRDKYEEKDYLVSVFDGRVSKFDLDKTSPLCSNFFPVKRPTVANPCKIEVLNTSLTPNDNIIVRVTDLGSDPQHRVILKKDGEKGITIQEWNKSKTSLEDTKGVDLDKQNVGSYYLEIRDSYKSVGLVQEEKKACSAGFHVFPVGTTITGIPVSTASALPIPKSICELKPNKDGKNAYVCNTAFGEISTDPAELIKQLFGILLSLSGGIALILIIVSGYSFIASQGNPEKVQGARETLTSAIVGLLFIIFSMVILQIVGVDILHIPGIGK